VSDAETKQYTNLIDGILMNADLETVTRKKIRQGLELALGGKDLSEQKVRRLPLYLSISDMLVSMPKAKFLTLPSPPSLSLVQNAIKALIEERFDAINTQNPSPGAMPTPPSAPLGEERGRPSPKREHSELNGHTDDGDDADGEIEVSLDEQPAKKKQKRDSKLEDADARLAAQLQAQENRMARTRTTRGGAVAKPTKPKKKTPKKKSASKIKGDDDSDVDSSEVSGTKRKASGGFQKPFNLSYPLAELCGESRVG